MTLLAPTLEKYFTQHLMHGLGASAHTIAAYRDAWRLLLAYTHQQGAGSPAKIELTVFDSAHIGGFLRHLEHDRGNSVRTRNARLAAIHSFFAYAAHHHPEHAETTGRRDHALILTAISTGLRVAELTGLTWADIDLGTGAHLLCHGKGRKDRATPLSIENVATLATWKAEQSNPDTSVPVFPTRSGTRMSTDAVAQRLTVHVRKASLVEPSLVGKKITPHVLRHSTAMRMLHAGIDTSVIALWLGHESVETTQIYLHADLALKETALERVRPTNTPAGRYAPGDELLAFLEAL